MNAEFVNPLEIKNNWSLGGIFPDAHETLYVWIDYSSGKISFTKWDGIPEELYDARPVARIYGNKYTLPEGLPCSRVLNYGPAAGGIGEAGAFKIQTCGERIDALVPQLGFKNRNLGALVTGSRPKEALLFIERFVGQFSISYASLFAMLAFEVPEPCKKYMHTALEMERVHNHVWVMHKLAADASQKVASAHLAAMTEELLRLNLKVLGHRYGMGYLRLGPRKYDGFLRDIKALKEEFVSLSNELLDSRIFVDRLHTTCTLKKEDILKNDIAGIPARAGGVLRDARKIGIMSEFYQNYSSPVEEDGDALARLLVRVKEIEKSFEFLENAEFGSCKLTPKSGFDYGLIEAPPGDAFMALKIKEDRIREFTFRAASLPLYHAFSTGIPGNVFTDFPFALDSFGAYFADADSSGRWL